MEHNENGSDDFGANARDLNYQSFDADDVSRGFEIANEIFDPKTVKEIAESNPELADRIASNLAEYESITGSKIGDMKSIIEGAEAEGVDWVTKLDQFVNENSNHATHTQTTNDDADHGTTGTVALGDSIGNSDTVVAAAASDGQALAVDLANAGTAGDTTTNTIQITTGANVESAGQVAASAAVVDVDNSEYAYTVNDVVDLNPEQMRDKWHELQAAQGEAYTGVWELDKGYRDLVTREGENSEAALSAKAKLDSAILVYESTVENAVTSYEWAIAEYWKSFGFDWENPKYAGIDAVFGEIQATWPTEPAPYNPGQSTGSGYTDPDNSSFGSWASAASSGNFGRIDAAIAEAEGRANVFAGSSGNSDGAMSFDPDLDSNPENGNGSILDYDPDQDSSGVPIVTDESQGRGSNDTAMEGSEQRSEVADPNLDSDQSVNGSVADGSGNSTTDSGSDSTGAIPGSGVTSGLPASESLQTGGTSQTGTQNQDQEHAPIPAMGEVKFDSPDRAETAQWLADKFRSNPEALANLTEAQFRIAANLKGDDAAFDNWIQTGEVQIRGEARYEPGVVVSDDGSGTKWVGADAGSETATKGLDANGNPIYIMQVIEVNGSRSGGQQDGGETDLALGTEGLGEQASNGSNTGQQINLLPKYEVVPLGDSGISVPVPHWPTVGAVIGDAYGVPEGHLVIEAHGGGSATLAVYPSGVRGEGKPEYLDAAAVVDMIKASPNYSKDTVIVFAACDTGTPGGLAEKVSSMLPNVVMGAPAETGFNPFTGGNWTSENRYAGDNQYISYQGGVQNGTQPFYYGKQTSGQGEAS